MKSEQRTPAVLDGDERATLTSLLQRQRDLLREALDGTTGE
ncbi:hypothetical protein [Streptomyces sp. NPDC048551]